ncbi:alpha/beta hydrolase [Chlamydia muridarum str. Nigg]|jgi:hypothetical protein|uniref:Membrane protein n=2 Tax=Chlamydia muridarum TaxID=83560 RepID=A0A097KH75_CHLMR|nr:alpha/beta hydrolase [Chlamydia muridarum]AAF39206.1 conserved hypothetical protein [Chlamydia muridarum str. Nigg]AHH22736.1 membrane protein [Chlamydia muridarum str. Nigg3 CMUT3-5]AHH23661.1 membrane protein [Chlamydia muridarum str. Nigg CM972]AID37876.1 membrane protein [Chlamydia muridarum str. Nigg 2 MCR]AIT90544.1 membrane protein [Chlamydia muridarum]
MKNFLLTILFLLMGTSLLADPAVIQTLTSGVAGVPSIREEKESVVCVHAFLRSYSSLKPIGRVLEKENYDVFIWNYETRKFTLERHAEHLIRLLNKIAELKPGVPINFVTHSVGGVIVRVALAHPDCPEEAKKGKAILMAPPNAGSTLARRYSRSSLVQFIFGGKLGMQLLTYSPEHMLNVAKMPSTVDVLVLSGSKKSKFLPFRLEEENDGKVCVTETRLDTPHQNYVIDANHTYIITNKTSLFLMKEFLRNGSRSPALTQVPEEIEANMKQAPNTTAKKEKSKDIYIIHCLGAHPYSLYGFPKSKMSSNENSGKILEGQEHKK